MDRKKIIIATIAGIILIILIVLMMILSGREDVAPSGFSPVVKKNVKVDEKVIAPENNVPKNNVTLDQMTEEQADFAKDFAKKTAPVK